jgi:hypothetical protein
MTSTPRICIPASRSALACFCRANNAFRTFFMLRPKFLALHSNSLIQLNCLHDYPRRLELNNLLTIIIMKRMMPVIYVIFSCGSSLLMINLFKIIEMKRCMRTLKAPNLTAFKKSAKARQLQLWSAPILLFAENFYAVFKSYTLSPSSYILLLTWSWVIPGATEVTTVQRIRKMQCHRTALTHATFVLQRNIRWLVLNKYGARYAMFSVLTQLQWVTLESSLTAMGYTCWVCEQ